MGSRESEAYTHAVNTLERLRIIILGCAGDARESPLGGVACSTIRESVRPFFDIDTISFHKLVDSMVDEGVLLHSMEDHILRIPEN